jgi:hypothetical protein
MIVGEKNKNKKLEDYHENLGENNLIPNRKKKPLYIKGKAGKEGKLGS